MYYVSARPVPGDRVKELEAQEIKRKKLTIPDPFHKDDFAYRWIRSNDVLILYLEDGIPSNEHSAESGNTVEGHSRRTLALACFL